MSTRLKELVLSSTPAQLQQLHRRLPPEHLAELEVTIAEIDAERAQKDAEWEASNVAWRQNPATMAHHLEGNAYELYPYVALLGEKARQLDTGEDQFQIWNLPAQYGKSKLGVRTMAWCLDKRPLNQYITTSYGDELATRNGMEIRDYLATHADELRVNLRRDAKRQDRFLTEEGGGLLAAGLFSGMTGFSADGVVIDDPYKGWQEAHSGTYRQRVSDTFKSVVWLRQRSGKTWFLVIMTRWHELDLTDELAGQLSDELGVRFTVTRLPEIAEATDPNQTKHYLRTPDPLGRKPGEVLEPRRFDAEAVRRKHLMLGEYLAAGLAQQRPAPAAGTEILREWFQLGEQLPERPDRAITSWDMKLKDSEAGDYVVGQLWWRVGGAYWCMDQIRGQWNQATTKAAMALMKVRHPEIEINYFENTGNGPDVVKELKASNETFEVDDNTAAQLGMTEIERELLQNLIRHGMSSFEPVNPKGDKSVRMRAVSPTIAGKNVWLPATAAWVPGYLEEMAAFPHGGHDDQVDSTSQALTKLTQSAASIQNPGRSLPQVRAGQLPQVAQRGANASLALPGRRMRPGPR